MSASSDDAFRSIPLDEDDDDSVSITGRNENKFKSLGSMGSEDRFSKQDRFSEHSSDGEAYSLNVSGILARKLYTKLEIVKASQIKTLLNWHHGFIGAAIVMIVIIVILLNTKYKVVFGHLDLSFQLVLYQTPDFIQWLSHVFDYINFLVGLILCITFCQRILRLRKVDRTHEQIWVMLLLFSMVLYLIPYQAVFKAHDLLINLQTPSKWWSRKRWFFALSKTYDITRTTAFTASTVFYIWANIHSYRILENKIRPRFYLFKGLVMLIYASSKITVFFTSNIYPAEVLFVTLFGMISLFPSVFSTELKNTFSQAARSRVLVPGILFPVALFVFELALAIWICYEVIRTKQVLKKSNYLQYRSKQVGFRFFLYHNLTFYSIFLLLHIILITSMPNGARIFALYQDPPQMLFSTSDFIFATNVLLLAYVYVEAYVNLPSDAIGFRGWFTPQCCPGMDPHESTDLKPITYRKKEPSSLNGAVPDFNVNCFVMQTHVTMFNFAWLVYYWGTPKADNFDFEQTVFKFAIENYIKDESTDTHVLIADGEDRIVVAFKGTTSARNLKTDLHMFYSKASSILPTCAAQHANDNKEDEGDEMFETPLLKSREWKRAKIHKGFATAYAAVGPRIMYTLKKMQASKRRPIFLTGHSLGGALATICSLDLLVRGDIRPEEIFVSTFGAPRVGNRTFMEIYNNHISLHWRIVVGPDVIAKLPKVGYVHVGKKVLITSDGDLFIDPNSLELNLWSGEVASIMYHRKASYLLAMRAWCERHHGDEYVPEFWPWPTSAQDSRRFEHAMIRSRGAGGEAGHPTKSIRYAVFGRRHKRILQLGAMIDALDNNELAMKEVILRRWERLTGRLLDGELVSTE